MQKLRDYEFRRYWRANRLKLKLHELIEEKEELEKLGHLEEEDKYRVKTWSETFSELALIPKVIGGNLLDMRSSMHMSSGLMACDEPRKKQVRQLRIQIRGLQSDHQESSSTREERYLAKLRELVEEIEKIEQQILDEESERSEYHVIMREGVALRNTHPLLEYYQKNEDRYLLMEVNEKLVCSINKTCCFLYDIAQQIDYLQYNDESWVRSGCKKVLQFLQDSAGGFDGKRTQVREYLVTNRISELNPELEQKVNCLMNDMCNSIMQIPRVCMELEARIENRPIDEFLLLRDAMNGIRGLLQIDLSNYQTMAETSVVDFGELATRDIRSGDDQPSTSNNHARMADD